MPVGQVDGAFAVAGICRGAVLLVRTLSIYWLL